MGNLTVTAIKAIKPAAGVTRHPDGDGLYLVVKVSGSKTWLLRVQAAGRRRDIGLGTFPAVSLAEAREKATQTRKQLLAGEDPVEAKRAAKRAVAAIPTFRAPPRRSMPNGAATGGTRSTAISGSTPFGHSPSP